ncbi:carboxypeptidase-like regulatory domain-containing protein [Hymenobacter gummosus]|uniref:Carboxypeptidase-like regulatory domain-containing protein n=1 Tax=Hymenobacter gummosus TaxID=1776032 RepID=A0A431U120_9BACT|nr:carboxypeptidase-like regulatory domain-containing protein [Hymenobacter gummosus]RTQ48596.1 carboxypeptidase-like regulatory domain-containing protein [Hymenobacter gummosus]
MTRATIQVQIPRPCSEAWEAMTPTGQGRHCAACQLTVTDFTQRTDAEVLALLRQAAGGRVCGRFRAEQLNRELVHAPAAAPRWRAWLLATATLLGLPAAASAQALRGTHPGGPVPTGGGAAAHPTQQLPAPAVAGQAATVPDSAQVIVGEPVAETPIRRIAGQVVDQTSGVGIPGVTVLLEGTTTGVSTDAQGAFVLALPPGSDTRTLRLSSIGYESQLVLVTDSARLRTVALAPDTRVFGDLEIVAWWPWYSPRGLWNRVRSLPRRLTGRW